MKVFKFSAVAMFAEDVREEVGGTQSIIGLLPDNLAVPSVPGMIPKLAIYTRIFFDPNHPPRDLKLLCRLNDTEVLGSDDFDREMVTESATDTKAKGGPIATLVSKIILGGLTIAKPGRIWVEVSHQGGSYVAGSLNIEIAPPPTAAS